MTAEQSSPANGSPAASSTGHRHGGAAPATGAHPVADLHVSAHVPIHAGARVHFDGAVYTAAGDDSYDKDWDGIEAADDPEHAALRLLHVARSMHDTSRWWTQRYVSTWRVGAYWPSDCSSAASDQMLNDSCSKPAVGGIDVRTL